MDGVDELFAGGAKDPRSGKSFRLEVFWARCFQSLRVCGATILGADAGQ